MNRFIKIFIDKDMEAASEKANSFAEVEKLEIVSAQGVFMDAGHTYEKAVLVVVYERSKSAKKSKKTVEEPTDD